MLLSAGRTQGVKTELCLPQRLGEITKHRCRQDANSSALGKLSILETNGFLSPSKQVEPWFLIEHSGCFCLMEGLASTVVNTHKLDFWILLKKP